MQLKNKRCIECGKEDQPWFSKKRCMSCSRKSYGKPKKITTNTSIKKKKRQEELDVYFTYHINRCTHSEETGLPIHNPGRESICHLIDKGRHKSMQSNLDNYIYLTLQEHNILDNRLFKNEFEKLEDELPNAWKIACERYNKLIPLCQEKTKFIEKLSIYLNKNN